MSKTNDADRAPVHAVVMRELSPRYAFGILCNRFGVRPAQREPVIRWLNNLVEAGYPIDDVCELCSRAADWGQFYDSATWWLMRKDRNEGRKTQRALIQPRSGLKEPTKHPVNDLGKLYA